MGTGVFAILGIICHELGHLVCGKLTGYRFGSFRIGHLLWTQENGRLIVRRSDALKGVASGQCLMRPPKNFEDFHFVFYNLGGGLANIAFFVICLIPTVLLSHNVFAFGFFFGGVMANLILALMNLVPMSANGVPNDAKNVIFASRSQEASRAFWMMFKIAEAEMSGKRPREFSEDDFMLSPDADMTNYLITYIRMMEAERLCDSGHGREGIALLEGLPLDRLPGYYKNAARAEVLFYYSAVELDTEKARGIYGQKGLKEYLRKIRQPGVMRALAAYQLFVEKDHDAGLQTLAAAKAANDRSPYPGFAASEADRLAYLEARQG